MSTEINELCHEHWSSSLSSVLQILINEYYPSVYAPVTDKFGIMTFPSNHRDKQISLTT